MEHPILFSSAMVEAILAGHKTQTRRLIKLRDGSLCNDEDIPTYDEVRLDYVMDFSKTYPYWQQLDCPKGKPGDLLWVRESWQAQTQSGKWWHEVKRDDRPLLNWAWTNPIKPAYDAVPPRWLPSIHMPREASRIMLEIVSVRIQLMWLFADHAGSAFWFQPRENLEAFLRVPWLGAVHWAVFAVITWLCVRNWQRKPIFLRTAFTVLMPVSLVLYVVLGSAFEVRVFAEVFPVAWVLATPSVSEYADISPKCEEHRI